MKYKKVKAKVPQQVGPPSTRDYIQWKGEKSIYQAPDTPAGKAILDRRRKA